MAKQERSNNHVTLRNAEILPGSWRDFSGDGQYATDGKRRFNIKLPADVAEAMKADGFNVRELAPRDPDDEMGYRIEVAVSYKVRPPQIWLITSGQRTLLDEGSINILDYADIGRADVIINASAWDVNGKQGIKAYLHKMFVTLREDELDLEYAHVPVASSEPSEDSGPRFEEYDD